MTTKKTSRPRPAAGSRVAGSRTAASRGAGSRPAGTATARRGKGRGQARRRARWNWTIVGVAAASLAVLIAVGALAFNSAGSGAPDVVKLSVRDADELIRSHSGEPGWVTLDVRTPGEFAEAHIADAVNVDFEAAGFRAEIGKLDQSASYVVYCRTDNRSGDATSLMRELGFQHVYDVAGGLVAWQRAGLPVTR